jgi:hypothetical protein
MRMVAVRPGRLRASPGLRHEMTHPALFSASRAANLLAVKCCSCTTSRIARQSLLAQPGRARVIFYLHARAGEGDGRRECVGLALCADFLLVVA